MPLDVVSAWNVGESEILPSLVYSKISCRLHISIPDVRIAVKEVVRTLNEGWAENALAPCRGVIAPDVLTPNDAMLGR